MLKADMKKKKSLGQRDKITKKITTKSCIRRTAERKSNSGNYKLFTN